MERRNYDTTLEVRAEGDGRTVVGIAVPYDKEQRISPTMTRVFTPLAWRVAVVFAYCAA